MLPAGRPTPGTRSESYPSRSTVSSAGSFCVRRRIFCTSSKKQEKRKKQTGVNGLHMANLAARKACRYLLARRKAVDGIRNEERRHHRQCDKQYDWQQVNKGGNP